MSEDDLIREKCVKFSEYEAIASGTSQSWFEYWIGEPHRKIEMSAVRYGGRPGADTGCCAVDDDEACIQRRHLYSNCRRLSNNTIHYWIAKWRSSKKGLRKSLCLLLLRNVKLLLLENITYFNNMTQTTPWIPWKIRIHWTSIPDSECNIICNWRKKVLLVDIPWLSLGIRKKNSNMKR